MTEAAREPQRYTTTAILLHWLSALAVLVLLMLGWYMAALALSPQRLKPFNRSDYTTQRGLLLIETKDDRVAESD